MYCSHSPKSPAFGAISRMKLGVKIRRSVDFPRVSPASLWIERSNPQLRFERGGSGLRLGRPSRQTVLWGSKFFVYQGNFTVEFSVKSAFGAGFIGLNATLECRNLENNSLLSSKRYAHRHDLILAAGGDIRAGWPNDKPAGGDMPTKSTGAFDQPEHIRKDVTDDDLHAGRIGVNAVSLIELRVQRDAIQDEWIEEHAVFANPG
jgi:hypothetical protein